MNVTATPAVPWLTATPASVTGIGQNQQSQTNIKLIPTTLLSINTPYVGVVNLQDNRVPPTLIPITFTVNVLPQPVIGFTPTTVTLTYSLSLRAAGGAQSVTVSNAGQSLLHLISRLLKFSIILHGYHSLQ
jgi:hypothetical protein